MPVRFKIGDPWTAKEVNRRGELLRSLASGVRPGRQVKGNANAVAVQVGMFSFQLDEGDYVIARTWDGTTEGTEDIKIAKEWLLRRTPFDDPDDEGELDRDGFRYVYSANGERTSTNTDDDSTEDQLITPAFVVGDVILAMKNVARGTGVILNAGTDNEEKVEWQMFSSGRQWMKGTLSA